MSRYFERALQRRQDIDLRTIGPYTGATIPWMGGMQLPIKYAKSPYYPTYPVTNIFSWNQAEGLVGDWKPDLVLTVDAGIRFDKKPTTGIVAHVATDPHVLNYDVARTISDKFFNMQKCYSKAGDIYLPYAFDPEVHRYIPEVKKEYDCALIGMPYEPRNVLVKLLRDNDITVNYQNGPVFTEYCVENNKARIGLNYSSLKDMTARVFEIMAMGLVPVINRVPDLGEFFEEGKDYVGFDSVEEALHQVRISKESMGSVIAYRTVWTPAPSGFPQHSYDERVQFLLKECGLI
jgi:hypothetical protein